MSAGLMRLQLFAPVAESWHTGLVENQRPGLFSPLDQEASEYPTLIGGRHETPEQVAWSFLAAADQLAADT
jgi:hypothetical protein